MRRFRGSGASLAELEALYTRRFADFASVAAAILHDRDAGRDAVQEAFAKAVRIRSGFRREGSLEGWLWRLLVTTALDERRRRTRDADRLARLDYSLSNGHVPDDDVSAAIAALPDRQKLVLFLRYYADLEYTAIADVLGIAVGTVGAALNAAHKAVRRRLEEVQT
jgi:RNA polymerase sigma-70 factor (ECF subfamily)